MSLSVGGHLKRNVALRSTTRPLHLLLQLLLPKVLTSGKRCSAEAVASPLPRRSADLSSSRTLSACQQRTHACPIANPRERLLTSDLLARLQLRPHRSLVVVCLFVVAVMFLVVVLRKLANLPKSHHDGRDPAPALGSSVIRAVLRLLRC